MSEHRRDTLTRLITVRGFLRVTDAADELGVSVVTIRGDLVELERRGVVVRVHGGAMPPAAFRETSLEASLDRDAAAKRAIGRAAAAMVTSGQSLYVDAGSTALALAEALVARGDLHDLVIVTSGLTIALALEPAVPRFTVIVTGGTLRPLQHSLVNPFAAPMLESLRLDVAFIGCNRTHQSSGATNRNLPDAEIKRLVMSRSARSILIADGSKLGTTDLAVIAPLDRFEAIITAGNPDTALIEQVGLDVIVADR